MGTTPPLHVKTIAEFHRRWGLPQPAHPLISVVDYATLRPPAVVASVTFDCYCVALKRNPALKFHYGQQPYDFDEGVVFCTAPQQVIKIDTSPEAPPGTGWLLFVHPDLLWNTPLAKAIRHYDYFHYATHEALFLAEREETTLNALVANIEREYQGNLDRFSHRILVSLLDTLLHYADRFYQRQFLTRRPSSHQVLERLETVLAAYFRADETLGPGLPTVQYVADQLHLSPSYLSGLLKSLTGRSTQQHIQDKVIELAKQQLSTTTRSISEIAYALGFEHPQSLSKLFKTKTQVSPLQFRQAFTDN